MLLKQLIKPSLFDIVQKCFCSWLTLTGTVGLWNTVLSDTTEIKCHFNRQRKDHKQKKHRHMLNLLCLSLGNIIETLNLSLSLTHRESVNGTKMSDIPLQELVEAVGGFKSKFLMCLVRNFPVVEASPPLYQLVIRNSIMHSISPVS